MFVYNITIKIEPGIETDWVNWQKEEHIPEVMSSGCFTHHLFFRLTEPITPGEVTYIVQYFSTSKENYERYIKDHAPALREKAMARWGDQFIAFRTMMELVN
ncbi:MAG TPA: DUF4286 family protein [Chitinophagaceae bacterium]|nr:DUF4286 family protein [Chitinophagaceae bacterium]